MAHYSLPMMPATSSGKCNTILWHKRTIKSNLYSNNLIGMEATYDIPKGYTALTPMLAARKAGRAIEWYKHILNAKEESRFTDSNGVIVHAEMKFGDCNLMLAEENPDYNNSPDALKGTSVILNLYVPDVDNVVDRAVKAGAKIVFPVDDQFYGDRAGRIQDPFGHMWIISTHINDVTPEEMHKHMSEVDH
jgi:PhnB protein